MFKTTIESLPNTSSVTIRKLKSLGIRSYFDLLNYFPNRYENYSLISPINKLQEGETVTVAGHIAEAREQITQRGFRLQFFKLADDTGVVELTFYNQPYLLTILKKGLEVAVAGQVKKFGRKLTIEAKEYEVVHFDQTFNRSKHIHAGRLVPVYPEKRGLSSRTIREKVTFLLEKVIPSDPELVEGESRDLEFLPKEIISYNQLIDEQSAYQQIHFPDSLEMAKKARERLSFDELFTIQLSSHLVKKNWEKEKVGNKLQIKDYRLQIKSFIDNLPFKLTAAQEKVWREILSDLTKEKPMNRFLQGEVGSGKTVVAALACYLTYLNGFKSLFMAPTEILANQHYATLVKLFNKTSIKVGLVTGSTKKYFQADIIVGTHALITKKFELEKIGLVIVDEQHRFGVSQRAELKNKGLNPHLLTMTATPIPRTVALTLYGELDLSIIDEMPVGRLAVKTYLVPKEKRQSCYQWIKLQVTGYKLQVFIVCPLIEESEIETMKSVRAAKKEFENLKKIFFEFKLGLLHGKLKSKEKNAVMTNFKNKNLDILVTTPVVEVGVDIPNATIMLIEGAERFGLAQLHQLRGRVGRSNKQSYCFLFSESKEAGVLGRLGMFTKTNDGNKLAEEDLRIRGPGDIYGVKQHGYLDLKIAMLSDYKMIEKTKKAVEYFTGHYSINNFPN